MQLCSQLSVASCYGSVVIIVFFPQYKDGFGLGRVVWCFVMIVVFTLPCLLVQLLSATPTQQPFIRVGGSSRKDHTFKILLFYNNSQYCHIICIVPCSIGNTVLYCPEKYTFFILSKSLFCIQVVTDSSVPSHIFLPGQSLILQIYQWLRVLE